MFPITCPDGSQHEFETPAADANGFVCKGCNTDYDDYQKACDKLNKLKEQIKAVVDFTNGGDTDLFATALFETMNETHRTLQQNFFRGLILFIDKMKDMPTDLRNEACVAWCKKVAATDCFLPHI